MSYHEVVEQGVLNDLKREPQWNAVLSEVRTKYHQGRFGDLTPFMHQTKGEPTLGDCWAMSQIYALWGTGKLVMRDVHVGFVPDRNSERAANAIKLEALPDPFSATLLCESGSDDDGDLCWSAPFVLEGYADGRHFRHTEPPRHVPLEVGSTRATTSWLHLAEWRGLARWPYGSEVMRLFVVIDPNWCTVASTWRKSGA